MRNLIYFLLLPVFLLAQNKSTLIIDADNPGETISRHIYGQFSEHLGRGIYEGIWVGEDSSIPNTRGIRDDVVEALKKLNIPNLRWPGGCFADEYHWMDGIGDPAERPMMINTHWGGVVEDNSFGTHQFLDLCEQLETEPYITAYQQNTLRDAFVAALTLNIFHKHARRVHMANIAQTINVLQAMILTDKEKMLLTPTYHVFEMYKTHMDAQLLPTDIKTDAYKVGNESMDGLSANASLSADGMITLSLANVNPAQKTQVECMLNGIDIGDIKGKILSAPAINSHNTFEKPDFVKSEKFSKFKISGENIVIDMPAKSIVTLYIQKD